MTKILELYGKKFAERVAFSENFRATTSMVNEACFVYVIQGTKELYSPTEKLVVNDKEAVLMKCGNYVACFMNETSIVAYDSIVFHIAPEVIKKAFGNKDLSFLKANNEGIDKSAVKMKTNKLLDSFVSSMLVYFDNPELVTENLLAAKLQELILLLCDSENSTIVNRIMATLYTPLNVLLEDVIEVNLYNNLSVNELALLTGRSEASFKRDFKKLYGESPAKYLKNKKLEKSARLLISSDLKISEIAWDCGFENAAHFSKSFHDKFGCSPKNYKMN